ncbi:MAG: alginate export family protein [Deltaproteobacteria bacterium]|nr:alginate export family protein [Deltaproteobacteria bacterium]
MKRLLILALSAVALVAFTVPAMAVDFDGSLRVRGENKDNTNFVENDGAAFVGQRARLTATANPTDDVTVKITIQDTRTWGTTGNTTDAVSGFGPFVIENNTLDLHEAYAEASDIMGSGVGVKFGRQEVNLGDQRLIGSIGWSNNGQSFDGWGITYTSDVVDVLLADLKILENGLGSNDTDLWIIQGSVKSLPIDALEVYYISKRQGQGGFRYGGSTQVAEETTNTFGFRAKGTFAGVTLSLEMPFQSGTVVFRDPVGDPDIDKSASAYAITASYDFGMGKIGGQYVAATGQDASGDITAFDQLYPTGHAHLGYFDLQTWSDTASWNINVSGSLTDQLSAKFDYWSINAAEEDVNGDTDIGAEYDLTLKYAHNDALGIQLGYSSFTGGTYTETDEGNTNLETMHYYYLQANAKF